MENKMENKKEEKSKVTILFTVFITLVVLAFLNIVSSQINFGHNAVRYSVVMSIACVQGWVILYYFMHLKWEDKLTKWFSALSLPFLLLFILGDIFDFIFRVLEGQFSISSLFFLL